MYVGQASVATVLERALTETTAHDRSLLAPLIARDPTAAAALWQRFAPTVFRILRRVLGPRAQIDDAVQDVLVRVFRTAHRSKVSSDLTSLVLKATCRVAYVRLRRSTRWLPFRFRAQGRDDSGVGHSADQELDAVLRFYRIIDRLGAWDRIAFALHFIEGLGPRAIAAALGNSSARTRRRLRRSLHKVYDGIRRDAVLRHLGGWARA